MLTHGSTIVPSYGAAYRRIMKLEADYEVNLKLWVSCNEEPNGPGYFEIHLAGGGDLFDIIPSQFGTTRARVIAAFDDPFASALWHCLDCLESTLQRYAGHLTTRPSQ